MNKVVFWRNIHLVCCALLIISYFLPSIKFDLGMMGFYSMSFSDMTFGETGDMINALLFIIPVILIVVPFIKTKWKYLYNIMGILNFIAFIILLPFIDDFTFGLNPALPGIGYILYFACIIGDYYINEKIKKSHIKYDEAVQRIELASSYAGFVCPNCGEPVKLNAKFCEKCGAKIEFAEDKKKVCPDCGTPYKQGNKFCEKCGKNLQE